MTQRIKVNNDQYSLLFETGKVAFPVDTKYQIIGDLTISTTIKNNVSSGTRVIALPYAGGETEPNNVPWLLRIVSQNRLEAFHEYGAGVNSSTTTVTTKVPTGKYVHITVVRDSVALLWKFYINGALKESIAYTNNASGGSTTALQVGCDTAVGTDYFKGNIKNLGIFNRCLSQEEITNLFFNKIVPTDFVEFFDFSEGTGETTTGKNGTVGTISGATWSEDVPNPPRKDYTNKVSVDDDARCSVLFDGASGVATIPHTSNFIFNREYTLSILVKPTVFQSDAEIFSKNGSTYPFTIRYRTSNGSIRFATYNGTGGLNLDARIKKNAWSHIVCTKSGNSNKLYVNNVLINSGTDAFLNNDNTVDILIGNRNAGTKFFNGAVKHAKIWNRALSADEITNLYLNKITPTNGLVLNLDLNEGSQATAYDTSGNGNNGILSGGYSWVSDTPTKKRKTVDGNLIYNGDFSVIPPFTAETVLSEKWIDGTSSGQAVTNYETGKIFRWYFYKSGDASAKYEKRNGKNTMRFDCTVGTAGTVGNAFTLGQPINPSIELQKKLFPKLNPNTSYILKATIETENVTNLTGGGVKMRQFQYSELATSSLTNSGTEFIVGTTPPTEYTVIFTTNANCKSVNLWFNIYNESGTFWVSDVSMQKTVLPVRGNV